MCIAERKVVGKNQNSKLFALVLSKSCLNLAMRLLNKGKDIYKGKSTKQLTKCQELRDRLKNDHKFSSSDH